MKNPVDPVSATAQEPNAYAAAESSGPAPRAFSELPSDDIIVSEDYERILGLLETGTPVVFVTGNAGTGKTTLIRYLRRTLNKRMVVVAPTGVAALNIDGVTIHSFFRLPPKIHEERDIPRLADRHLYQALDLLVIDEISMVRCDLLDSIDLFLRKNRSNHAPFGGVQVLLVGDLFQLPPVVPEHEGAVLAARGYTSPYFFSSFSLEQTEMACVELTTFYRQSDPRFIALLNNIRIDENTDAAVDEINQRCLDDADVEQDVMLTATNRVADHINDARLEALGGTEHTLVGTLKGRFVLGRDRLPSPDTLTLRHSARVMFTKNDEERRWVNGSIGIVRDISDDCVRVEMLGETGGRVHDVVPVTWQTYTYTYDPLLSTIVGEVTGEYTQFPLMLAWACTIHKSQGKTLESVLVDLGSGAFASGQAYVALSRCRGMDGIRLARPLRASDIRCDHVVKRFYRGITGL
jgi:hypothetical protein